MIKSKVAPFSYLSILPGFFSWNGVLKEELSPETLVSLAKTDFAHQFSSRLDDLGFFPRLKQNLGESAKKSKGYCEYIRLLWDKTSGETDPMGRWNAFFATMEREIVGDTATPFTTRWAMKKVMDGKRRFLSSNSPSWPVGTYLSSYTIRHIYKMFLYPFECLPLEKILSQAQQDLGGLWTDVILHQNTEITHTGPFAGYMQPDVHPSVTKEPKHTTETKKPIWELAQQLSIHVRQDGVLKGFDRSSSQALPPETPFPGLTIVPYRHSVTYRDPFTLQPAKTEFVTYPEYVCRYSVNFHEPKILAWWTKQVALELVSRAKEIATLSGGAAHLAFVKFDNVTPSEKLMNPEPRKLYGCFPANPGPARSCDSPPYQALNEWEIRFLPTRKQYFSFFEGLRLELNRLAETFALKEPLFAKTLWNLRFIPNIPGSPLQVERFNLSSVVDGYFSETPFDPRWTAILVAETLKVLRSWMEQGKWLFIYTAVGCGSTPHTIGSQRQNQNQTAAALRLLLETSSGPTNPYVPSQPPPFVPLLPSKEPTTSIVPPKRCYETERPEFYQGQYVFPSSPQAPGLPGWMPGEARRLESRRKAFCTPHSSSPPRSPSTPRPDRLPEDLGLPGLFLLQYAWTDPCTDPAHWFDLLAPLGKNVAPTQFQQAPLVPPASFLIESNMTLFPENFVGYKRNVEDSLLLGFFQNGRLFLSFLSIGCWSLSCTGSFGSFYQPFCASPSSPFGWRSSLLPRYYGSALPRPMSGLPLPSIRAEYKRSPLFPSALPPACKSAKP